MQEEAKGRPQVLRPEVPRIEGDSNRRHKRKRHPVVNLQQVQGSQRFLGDGGQPGIHAAQEGAQYPGVRVYCDGFGVRGCLYIRVAEGHYRGGQ